MFRIGINMRQLNVMLVFILVFGMNTNAAITVGDREINLPFPEGYTELTPEMGPFYDALKAYQAPTNYRYMTLVPANTAEAMLQGVNVEFDRYMNVEAQKSNSTLSVSSAEFAEFRVILRNQIDELFKSVQKDISAMVDKGNATISEQYDAEIAVELGGMVPLPIHLDTEKAMANSMFMTVKGAVDGENMSSDAVAVTTVFLHVRDKLLFLYIYGSEDELDWTREMGTRWATDIIAANPLSEDEARTLEKPAPGGIDWGQVLRTALIAGAIGGVFGFGMLLFRKKKEE